MNKNHLDKNGRLPVSVHPRNRKLFNAVCNFAKSLGLNRSKFLVEAALMLAVDYGFELPQEGQDENKTTSTRD